MSTGGSSGQTSTVKTGPPDYAKDYVTGSLADANRLYQSGGPAVWQGSLVPNLSPETTQSWGATAARATNGSPINAAAGNYLTNTLNGNYLNQALDSPLNPVYNSVANRVVPTVDSQFSMAGRYGPNAAMNNSLATGITDAFAPYALSQYQGERGMQQAAAQQAPTAAGQDYQDLSALAGVGQARDAYSSQLIQDAYQRFQANQNRPYDALSWYTSQLYGSPYRQETQQAPSQGFNWGGFLGGLTGSAAQIGSAALMSK